MKHIIMGGPRSGKSTYARELRRQGIPTYCTDPLSLVKDQEEGVTYLPEGLDWSDTSQYIADHWFDLPCSLCVEGIASVRALRKYLDQHEGRLPDYYRLVMFNRQYGELLEGQRRMGLSVQTIWKDTRNLIKGPWQIDLNPKVIYG